MNKTTIHVAPEGDVIRVTITNLGVALKRRSKSRSSLITIFSPNLKVQGFSTKNENEAWRDFEENLRLFFSYHLKENTLDSALESFKWQKRELSVPDFNTDNSPALKTKDFELALPIAA